MTLSAFDDHPTRARINLSAFRQNVASVRSRIDLKTKILAVVKANAYGHGMLTIADAAIREGVDYLGVARIDEALQLRRHGIRSPILVFELVRYELFDKAIAEDIDLTVSSIEGARELEGMAERMLRKAKIQVKIDTGMGRLGLDANLAVAEIETISRSRWLDVAGVYSHFATSEDPDQTFARQQLSTFNRIVDELRARGMSFPCVHMANSGAIMTMPEAQLSMVRPGIMLYGYAPGKGLDQDNPLMPVMSLESCVTFVKRVPKGVSISYGRKYETSAETRIATIPVGYGDGFSRMLTGKAHVLIGGVAYPVAGTICMDHLMVDVGPESDIHEGDPVVLIGKQGRASISAWDIADALGTIPYEVTCMIAPRVARIPEQGTLGGVTGGHSIGTRDLIR
jgi:alanine racemase